MHPDWHSADELARKSVTVEAESTSKLQIETFAFSSWAFQRCIGAAYFFAFGSLFFQLTGLIGHNGILPIDKLVEYARLSSAGFRVLGLLTWFGTGDFSLQFFCGFGALSSLLAMVGVCAPISFTICWLSWLTLILVGQDFLSFQWDILLLEAGFITIFMAPWRLVDFRIRTETSRGVGMEAPPAVSIWLFRWLLFRLMFESGLCKLLSGDNAWRDLTAMTYHFHTQPLPTPPAWLFDKLPDLCLKTMTFLTLAIELVCPFFIAVKRLRVVGAALLMLLQVGIAVTGNYTYFNLLTFALCFFLFNDSEWHGLYSGIRQFWYARPSKHGSLSTGVGILPAVPAISASAPRRAHKTVAILSGVLIAALSICEFGEQFVPLPDSIAEALLNFRRLYIVNSYGLFATMTTVRDEIILEGSNDGLNWKSYEFKFKPGDPSMPPCIVAPYQPRLDWQMWFASLGDLSQSPWFAHFVVKIFENSPEVLSLLRTNPFPGKPPTYLRANLYRYTFSDAYDLVHNGHWWKREFRGPFLPVVSAGVDSKIPDDERVSPAILPSK